MSSDGERRILLITCVAHFLTHYFELLYPAMTMFVVRDLSASEQEVIAAGFGLYLLYGALAIPIGLLGDRYEPAVIMSFGILVAGLGSIGAGLLGSLPGLWLCLAIVGIGIAGYHPTGMALISKGIARRGRALGINGVWGNIGIVTGPLVGGVGGYFIGWRAVMLCSGVAGVVIGVIGLLLKLHVPRDAEATMTEPLRRRQAGTLFLVLLAIMALGGTIYRACIVTLPVYLEHNAAEVVAMLDQLPLAGVVPRGEVHTMGAGLLLSLACLVGVVGQRIGGSVADRFNLCAGYGTFLGLALPGLLAISVLRDSALVLAVAWFLLFFLGMQPIENSLVARLTPPRWRSTSYGMKFTVTFGLGSFAVWLVAAARSMGQGLSTVFLVLTGVLGVVVLGVVVLGVLSRGVSMRQRPSA